MYFYFGVLLVVLTSLYAPFSRSFANINRNSDTKALRILLTNSCVCGTLKLINTAMLFNLLYQKERHNERVCSTPHLW